MSYHSTLYTELRSTNELELLTVPTMDEMDADVQFEYLWHELDVAFRTLDDDEFWIVSHQILASAEIVARKTGVKTPDVFRMW
jgi:hypothetical protein